MTDLAPIHALLAAKEAEIAAIDAQREVLCRDAEVLRDALRAMGDPTIPPKAERKTVVSVLQGRKATDSRAGARMSDKWKSVFAKLAERDGEFTYEDVTAVAPDVKKELARTKMSDFKARGLLTGKKPGYFSLTERGRQIAREYSEAQKSASQEPEQPKPELPKVEAPGAATPGAPVTVPVPPQSAAPVSGVSNPAPAGA